jgi:hypothetical protein
VEERPVAWFRRRKERRKETGGSPGDRPATRLDTQHLEEFVQSRRGVEAFIEPRTTVTETTVLLIAYDGEWTRRRVDGPEGARRFAHKMSIPIYDVALVGYPQRMRDFNERRKRAARAEQANDT